jgi:hypothetical protein
MELIFFGFEAGKSITRGIGIGGPWNGSCTPQNLYVARYINNRYINSYSFPPLSRVALKIYVNVSRLLE